MKALHNFLKTNKEVQACKFEGSALNNLGPTYAKDLLLYSVLALGS